MKVELVYINENTAKIVLNRPNRKNAVDFDVIDLLDKYLDELSVNKKVAVVIFQGAGGSFCSGGDLKEFHDLKTSSEAKKMLFPMCNVLKKIVGLKAVTISFLDGPAIGGGAELASATDYTLASNRVQLGFVQAELAITTGWGGASLLQRRIGYQQALKMLVSAKIYNLDQLVNLKFVDSIANNEQEVIEWSRDLLIDQQIMNTYKLNLFPEDERQKLFVNMQQESERCAKLWELDAHHEAVARFKSTKNR